jgi:uncharacterized protein (DUF58 family)
MSIYDLPKHWALHFSSRDFRNSLIATLALGLALGSALASSAAAQEGNLATAIVMAISSLVLAAIISITVVPRLLRRARREWLCLSFTITREGWFYIITLMVIAVAALNTGNNLIFLIFSAALSTLIVSELTSNVNLRHLHLKMDLPAEINAQQSFSSVLSLQNLKPWLPSFSLSVEGREAPSGLAPPTDKETRFRLGRQAYYPFLPGGTQSRQKVRMRFARRGRYVQPELEISTRFPFGFVKKRKRMRIDREIIVFPEIAPPNEFFEMLPLLIGALESHYRGCGSDLYSIRDYFSQDNARFLDWKATAKTGRLKLREFTQEEDRKCCFLFDNSFLRFDEVDRPAFEKAVTLCANAARHFHEMGIEIRLATPEASTLFSQSREGVLEILRLLALIEPISGKTYSLSDLARDRAFKILFTGHPRGAIPTFVWNSSHVVFMLEL